MEHPSANPAMISFPFSLLSFNYYLAYEITGLIILNKEYFTFRSFQEHLI
jgi:hypothetical protein